MTQEVATPAPLSQVTRKPSRLMADLTAAILATTEAARDRALATIEADATQVTEAIRAASMDGAEAIRRQAEDDLTAIKDWSKTEIARIREEAETKTETRKTTRESELTAHAAAVDRRVGEVQEAVTLYRTEMDAYFGNLASEDDPARLATMAEAMPEPPPLNALADLADLDLAAFAPAVAVEAETEVAEAEAEVAEAEAEVAEAETEIELAEADLAEADLAEAEAEVAEAELATAETVETEIPTAPVANAVAVADWGTSDDAWDLPGTAVPAGEAVEAASDDIPGWTTGVASDNSLDVTPGGEPFDRDAIMDALEAAAEAVVVAEAAAESADPAEVAAESGAESAADLLAGRIDTDGQTDDAQAALAARVDAGGFDSQSFTDRLASLMPSPDEGAADAEPRTTRVIVTGLVSVASIASFKRHLSRLAGVKSVGVASGPDGEFVFNVSHRPDASFRDGIPSMPGFGARVTRTGDGFVQATARDPESDG